MLWWGKLGFNLFILIIFKQLYTMETVPTLQRDSNVGQRWRSHSRWLLGFLQSPVLLFLHFLTKIDRNFQTWLTEATIQRTLTVGGRIMVWLDSSFTTASPINRIFSFLVKSILVKLQTSHTVIVPPTVSVLWTI